MYIILDDGIFLNLDAVSAITKPQADGKAVVKFQGAGQIILTMTKSDRERIKAMAVLSQRVAIAQADSGSPGDMTITNDFGTDGDTLKPTGNDEPVPPVTATFLKKPKKRAQKRRKKPRRNK